MLFLELFEDIHAVLDFDGDEESGTIGIVFDSGLFQLVDDELSSFLEDFFVGIDFRFERFSKAWVIEDFADGVLSGTDRDGIDASGLGTEGGMDFGPFVLIEGQGKQGSHSHSVESEDFGAAEGNEREEVGLLFAEFVYQHTGVSFYGIEGKVGDIEEDGEFSFLSFFVEHFEQGIVFFFVQTVSGRILAGIVDDKKDFFVLPELRFDAILHGLDIELAFFVEHVVFHNGTGGFLGDEFVIGPHDVGKEDCFQGFEEQIEGHGNGSGSSKGGTGKDLVEFLYFFSLVLEDPVLDCFKIVVISVDGRIAESVCDMLLQSFVDGQYGTEFFVVIQKGSDASVDDFVSAGLVGFCHFVDGDDVILA